MSDSQASTAAEVEAVLAKRAAAHTKPTDEDLRPLYNFLRSTFVSTRNQSTSAAASDAPHWYCSRAPSKLHREVATYLIFLFAFNKVERAQLWIQELEGVLKGCEKCARGFAAARRRFSMKYLSNFPAQVRTNFFAEVDRRQADFILREYNAAAAQTVQGVENVQGLAILSPAMAQLALGEPSLMHNSDIAAIIDATAASAAHFPAHPRSLTPVVVHLLSSDSTTRRAWAISMLPTLSRHPLTFDDWCDLGIGVALLLLFSGESDLKGEALWTVARTIMKGNLLELETLEQGLLSGRVSTEADKVRGRSIMSIISPLLGTDDTDFPVIFSCFTSLLEISPSRYIWAFDPSAELPHTLFSDIKGNAAFQRLIEAQHDGGSSDSIQYEASNPLSWISNFLLSLGDVQTGEERASPDSTPSGFGEALAKASSFTFSEMQHSRLSSAVRAAAASAGFEALISLQIAVKKKPALAIYLSSTLDIHASFITGVALRPKLHPEPDWRPVRESAKRLLAAYLMADTVGIVESSVGLAVVAYEERLRQRKIRSKKPTGPPIKVDQLRKASMRRELWAMAYNAVLPYDAAGVAVFMKAVAVSSHIELLDRQNAWKGDDLIECISREDWVDAIRAINSGIQGTHSNFSHTIESLTVQPDPEILESLWKIPGAPKSATILLLSPAEAIHDPILGLIQQSFDADERGDCFRELLRRFPAEAIDGLCEFLSSFIGIARVSPESCSLAKWLVRCFTDILEALCQPSDSAEPLLNSASFLATYANDRSMSRRLQDLWHLMTTSLAVIFKRTQAWAPLFENEVMIDWMRDAIIFGRQMTEHTRMFEAAVLGQAGAAFAGDVNDAPVRVTRAGKDLVGKLHIVLVDLVTWLRLTDVEILHQTFQLLKDILTHVSRTKPDLGKCQDLERALLELDKFCRKPTKSYTSRLSDDLISELSELLAPFNLGIIEDEISFVKAVEAIPAPSSSSSAPEAGPSASRYAVKSTGKNAFEELMRGPKSSRPAVSSKSSTSTRPSAGTAGSSSKPIDIDDEIDDGFLMNLSSRDLDLIEKRAVTAAATGRSIAGNASVTRSAPRPAPAMRPPPSGAKLNINVVPKAPTQVRTGFKSAIMRDARQDVRHANIDRARAAIGGIVPKLPTASTAGTGLGAYQPVKPKIVPKADSGSSASESSDDDDKGGLSQLIKKQKSPLKPTRMVHVPRSIQVMSNPMLEAMKRREDDRARKARMKARLKPDLNPLYRHVLGWDPSHTGPNVPHSDKMRNALISPGMIPAEFSSAERYAKSMLPLFLQELWMQALKGDGNKAPLVIEVTARSYEDDFLDLEVALAGQMPERFTLNESDIVVLEQPGNPKRLFAKVQGYRRRFKDAGIKLRIMMSMDQRELSSKTKWFLHKHLSLSTAVREFAALQGLPYYEPELLRDILAAKSARLPKLLDAAVSKAMHTYEVNEPQAKAILAATSVDGFALIQGPPGTGKTKTISGLVGKWISERPSQIALAGEKPKKAKLLVCAPSNAAIDEVCKRLMNGVPAADGQRHHPNLVRIGVDSSVNDAVKDRSLDNLVEARISSGPSGQSGGGGEYGRIQAELDDVKEALRTKADQLRNLSQNDEGRRIIETEHQGLMTRRTQLGQLASKAKDAARDATRHLEGARRAAKEAILDEADIVCATLSGAGQDILAAYEFETVIIDEAAQAIEMSCLIPLKYGCKRCIMVGDPNQLPPTTFSTDAERFRYNESLFVRMARVQPQNMHLLSIQYRMHPYISELPSKVFYNSQLKDGPNMADKTTAIWHSKHVFGPYRFFNVDGRESKAGTSTKNADEAGVAISLYRRLEEDFGKKIDLAFRIGVITMYKEQLYELKRAFNQAFGADVLNTIEFNTVDGFQGQEKDIIILSCVRSGPNLNSIGFLKDARRMNVALTRAKSSLFVIGNASTLERGDQRWKTIVDDARQRGFVIDYKASTFAADASEPYQKKKVKKDTGPKPEKKPLINGSKSPTPAAALATPLKRKSLDAQTREIKKPKIPIKVETGSTKQKRERASSTSSASTSSASDSDAEKAITKPREMPTQDVKPRMSDLKPTIAASKAPPIVNGSSMPVGRPAPPKSAAPPRPIIPPAPVNPASVAFIKKKKKPNIANHNPSVPAASLGSARHQVAELYGAHRLQ